ncbi:MAG: glycoside hydrolase family 2 protein [Acetatifactor sp.]
MSTKTNWNSDWKFSKENTETAVWEQINLPHTWNGTDGQDGGDDYYRGTCYYKKTLTKSGFPKDKIIYLEFEGTNSSAVLYVNGRKVMSHDGGYSTWRADITEYLEDENEILVSVDNAPNDYVYPQKADFTFYGGIYRNVNLLCVEKVHFDLDYFGGPGVKITPKVTGNDACVTTEVFLTGADGSEVLKYQILDADGVVVEALERSDRTTVELKIENVHLWNGRKDPYLYTLQVSLLKDGNVLDERRIPFGCRTFEIDSEKGFLLNGESYPLHGVSRHQDRPRIGNALLPVHHEEDMELICELGATTIRLAHYQHDQYFYNLCDEKGMIVWAEIPYISRHLEKGRDNTLLQMRELIIQNYNHPSIVVWGLSNEITMGGVADPELLENHHALNDLAHQLDATRLTTQAVVTMCSMDEEYVHIPDVVSYNHYFGWYGGDTSMNGEFMDKFHKKYPDKAIGMSEYGCEALNWHSSEPVQGDYTEEYQAHYHEELIKQLFTRPYIWATHVWNMFDFAADARSEGGEDGMNHKGLVTFDRKYKKDAFYAYKAWLSPEPFVHICGKRYVDRVEETTKVTVYSNQPVVELFLNGESLEKQKSENHFFYFSVPNHGSSTLTAKAGDCTDESTLRKVDVFNEEYRMKEAGEVINWFEITTVDGYFSINDKLGDILANKKGARFIKGMMIRILLRKKLRASKNTQPKDKSRKIDLGNPEMQTFLYGMSVKRLISMAGTMGPGLEFKKEDVLKINRKLNRIKK